MDDKFFMAKLNKLFSEMQEIMTPKWRSRPDPIGSANKVISSSKLVESAIQNFPKFDGSDPKLWIRKCDRAFLLHPVPQDQKVIVASSQFEKKAEIWYQLVYARRMGVTWREFSEAVLNRFLNEKQEVVVYESHEEFRPPASIIVTKPATLQEASVEASIDTKVNSQPEMYPIILLTQAEMKARWDKDLCYNCDEVYSFEHRCAKIQLYMLEDEEEGDEEEVENTEIVFDSGGELIEVPDPEDSAKKVISISDIESPIIPLPKPKPTPHQTKHTKPGYLITPPITPPIQIHSSQTINLNTDSTPNLPTLPYPNQRATIIPPIQNLLTLSYPNPNSPPIQIQSFHSIKQNTAAFLDANRPEPWPNKPSINTNPNRPNPWPNKLPKLTYFIRPKPWPDEPPIHKHKQRTSFVESRKLTYMHGEKEASRGVVSASSSILRSKPEEQFRVFSVADRMWKLVQNRVLAVAQLRNKVIAILRHLPEFDPGDQRPPKEESNVGGDVTHFGRIFEGKRRRIEASGRRFSERRRIGNVKGARVSNELNWGFRLLGISENNWKNWGFYSKEFWLSKKKEIWDFVSRDFGFGLSRKKKNWKFLSNDMLQFVMEEILDVVLVEKVKDLVVVLMEVCREKEEDLCFVEEEAATVAV